MPAASKKNARIRNAGGRPLNVQAADALLEAARELVTEQGYAQVTMQAIAERAGVGRQTAFRRWGSKADLVLHALLRYSRGLHVREPDAPVAVVLERFLVELFADINALHGVAIPAWSPPRRRMRNSGAISTGSWHGRATACCCASCSAGASAANCRPLPIWRCWWK